MSVTISAPPDPFPSRPAPPGFSLLGRCASDAASHRRLPRGRPRRPLMPGAGASRSAWMDGVPLIPGDGPLAGDAQADVCVVGAGVAGLTTAYLLAREGRSVIVLDDGPPGMGESLRTTAHLTAAMDDRIHVLSKKHGSRKARLVVESTLAGIDRIARI